MSDINNFEIIQNKLDALVEKIIQKENSDEDFRITYAQILEKINTKMDIFSNTDNGEHINAVASELISLIKERQDVVDAKFNAVKGEFDNLNDILDNSLKTTELISAFNKIQDQIKIFSEEQENQKFAFNSIVSHIEKFGTLEDTNENINSNFEVVKEQNSSINDNLNNSIELIQNLKETIEENNVNSIDSLANLLFAVKEFSTIINENFENINTKISEIIEEKVTNLTNSVEETNTTITILNTNMTTLLKAVDCIYEYEPFENIKKEVSTVLAETVAVSELIKKMATREELKTTFAENKDDLKNYIENIIKELEQKLLTDLDFSALDDIKNYTEKMFFQGTEVLKEEMWTIKDSFNNFNNNSVKQDYFNSKIDELKKTTEQIKNDITDIISEESVAASNQLKNISSAIDILKTDVTDIISEESVATSNQLTEIATIINDLKLAISNIILNEQNEQITTALQNLQSKFITQIVQIADNITFSEEADELHENLVNCTEELKDKITSDIEDVKNEITSLRGFSDLGNENIIDILNKIENVINSDVTTDLKTVISSLKLLTSGLLEDQDHIYTMPDIETDLSKIRLELDKIQKSINNTDTEDSTDIKTKLKDIEKAIQNLELNAVSEDISEIKTVFNSINEDIASISKRTNRLILASDEVSKTLKSNISAFSVLLGSFERQSREFYNSAFMIDLNEKIESLSKMTTMLVQSDQAMNEAFMYIGEWIDTTSDSFDELKTDVTKIKKGLLSEEAGIAEKLEYTVNTLAQRIELQDSKIEAIDEKLNKLAVQMQETKEIKSLVEYISSQISLANEKIIENDKLAQKIDSMDKQLKKIEKNISVITEYLDDDTAE